jgi:hypothetical protein
MVQVVTRKTIVIGAGRHRRRVTRPVVAYRAALRGTADRHGRFTARLRIAYRRAGPAPARLTVTALKGCRSTAHTLGLTIRPRPQQPLLRRVTPRYLAATHTLLVGNDTLPRAQVTVTLQVVRRKVIVAGQGRSRRRVVRAVVLYRSTVTGTANAHGHVTARLRVAYRPLKAVQARMLVTVRTPRGTSTRSAPVTL